MRAVPLNETRLDAVRGAYITTRFQPVHQQKELVGAMLLRSSINKSFYIIFEGLDSILRFAVTVAIRN